MHCSETSCPMLFSAPLFQVVKIAHECRYTVSITWVLVTLREPQKKFGLTTAHCSSQQLQPLLQFHPIRSDPSILNMCIGLPVLSINPSRHPVPTITMLGVGVPVLPCNYLCQQFPWNVAAMVRSRWFQWVILVRSNALPSANYHHIWEWSHQHLHQITTAIHSEFSSANV